MNLEYLKYVLFILYSNVIFINFLFDLNRLSICEKYHKNEFRISQICPFYIVFKCDFHIIFYLI